ncbi:MAG: enoyl-CoA hydratase/isomerase family protein [Thermomicrobiales bacterium]
MTQSYAHILVETTPAGVRTLTLNRPDVLNAINTVLADELPAAIQEASGDEAVRVLVITGAGRGFCSGLDLVEASQRDRSAPVNPRRRLDDLGWVGRQALALVNCDKPVIAAINGVAAGAGFGLMLGADIRLISANATLTTGYVRRGLSPDAGVTYFLPRLVGLSRATELILTARDFARRRRSGSNGEPHSPGREFRGGGHDYAEAGRRAMIALTKRLLVESLETDITAQLRGEIALIGICFTTEDTREAMRAFIERRQPRFEGK